MKLNLYQNFEDYYGIGNYHLLENSKIQVTTSYERFFIYFCLFQFLFNNKGGSIFIESLSCNLLIENSLFINSTSNFEGGGLYFNCNSGSIIIKRTCSTYCYTGVSSEIFGQFGFITVSNSNFIIISSLSISKCSPFQGHSSGPIVFRYGNQSCKFSNSSYNLLYRHSGIDFWSSLSFKLSYSTFVSNKVTGWLCLYFFTCSNPCFASFINVVDNNSFSRGISICDNLVIYISNSNFFQNEGILFDIRITSNLYIFHCFFDSFSTDNKSPFTYFNNSITSKYTYHFIYSNCFLKPSKNYVRISYFNNFLIFLFFSN